MRTTWIVAAFGVLVLLLAGCSKSDNPVGEDSSARNVSLAVVFSKTGSTSLGKTTGLLVADSLRIDSAVVVFQRIKFESHIDSVHIDTTGLEVEDEREFNITFRGPYVVHIRDTVSIDFADQLLPAGTYDGIKFKIHRLVAGEKYEDSDEHNNRPRVKDDAGFLGASIVVWGSVKREGTWVAFVYKYNGEVEFKMKGNYTVSESTSTVNIVLRFDMGMWFRNLNNGSLLDPTDTSSTNRALIAKSIHHSFERGRGGHDSNHDGHPDDD